MRILPVGIVRARDDSCNNADAICAYVAEHGGADEVKCRIAMAALVGAIWNVADTWPEPRGAKILDACRRELLDAVPADLRGEPTVH